MGVTSKSPANHWGESTLSACFLQDRISFKKSGKTPYELWERYLDDVKFF